jgi:tRNA-binding protein
MTGVEAFEELELRVGRVLRAEVNEKARKPAHKLWIDFGEQGERRSSAQLAALYQPGELVGLPDAAGQVVLLQPERDVPVGGRVY